MYRGGGVDGSITEEDWGGGTHQLHFLLPQRDAFLHHLGAASV